MASRQPQRPHLVHKRKLVHHLLHTKYLERIPRQNSEPMSVERVLARLYYRKHKAVAVVHAGLPEGFRQDVCDRLHLELGGGEIKGGKQFRRVRDKPTTRLRKAKKGTAPGS